MICSRCQTANADTAKFCRNCGAALTLSCTNCGAAMAPGDRFCSSCGQPAAISTATDDNRLSRLNAAAPASLADKIRTAQGSSDRKVVTVLFADVVGSTSLAEQLDAEDWTAIMNRAFDRLSPPIYRYEGTIARLLGDALLAFFGAPVAHEDDPVRAVRAALDLLSAAREYAEEVRRDHGIDFAIRVGINTGLVVVGNVGSDLKFEYTAMGDAVNLAARMQSAARPMSVLIAQNTYRFIAPFFDCADLGLIDVKGKAEPVRVYEVQAAKAQPGTARGLIGVGLESPMVGREAELTALRRLSSAVQAGSGRTAVIIGEPGLGKSRLIAEWKASSADKPIQWAEGQCLSYGQGLAYHLALSALRSLLGISAVEDDDETRAVLHSRTTDLFGGENRDVYPYLGHMLSLPLEGEAAERIQALDPQALHTQYLAAFRELLRAMAARNPLALILEDVHWADPSSIELLAKLLPLAREARLLFCFITRPDRDAPGWKLVTAAHEIMGDSLTELKLQPLSEADSQQLVSNLLEIQALPQNVRALIYKKAEGNPFFVEEVIRMMIDRNLILKEGDRWVAAQKIETVEIPDNLLGLLLARIDRQPDDVKRTMRIASVIGRQFPVKVLEHVLGQEEAGLLVTRLNTLEAASLIRLAQVEPDLEYLFRHALVQDAAYESLLKKDRQRLHQAVGHILENLYPERLDELAPVLGHHFYEAGTLADAQKYFTAAGDSAARRYANMEAVAHYTRAIEAAGQTSAALPSLYHARGRVHESMGDFDSARADHEQALSLARNSADRHAEWESLLNLGMLWAGRDYSQTGQYFQQAFDLAKQLDDPASLAYSLNRVGNWHANLEEPHIALEYHQQALDIFNRLEDKRGVHETLDLLAMTSFLSADMVKGFDYSQQTARLAREMGNRQAIANSLSGWVLCGGNWQTSTIVTPVIERASVLEAANASVQIAREIGWRAGEAYNLVLLGAEVYSTGDIAHALELTQRALAIAEEIEHHQWIVLAISGLASIYLDLFAAAAIQPMLERGLNLSREIGSLHWIRSITALLTQAYTHQGLFDRAREVLDSALGTDVLPQTYGSRNAWNARAELALACGDYAEAMRCLDTLFKYARNVDERGDQGIMGIALLRGRVLTEMIRTGKSQSADTASTAESYLIAAQKVAQARHSIATQWRAYAALAKLYSLLGRDEAKREIAAAKGIIDQLASTVPQGPLRETFLRGAAADMSI